MGEYMAATGSLRGYPAIGVVFFWGALFAGGAHAVAPVDYHPGDVINFESHALTLSAEVEVADVSEILDQHIAQESRWVAPADRSRISLFDNRYNWQRIDVRNASSDALHLYLRHKEPNLVTGQFAVLKAGETPEIYSLGTARPFAERPVPHRNFLIPFSLAPGETVTLVAGYDGRSLLKSTEVLAVNTFWAQSETALVGDGMYFGASLIVSLLVVLLFIGNRDPLYLYFYVIVFGNLAYVTIREGYAYQYLWPQWAGVNDELVLIAVHLSLIGAICFTRRFLGLSQSTGAWLYHCSNIYLVWNLVLIALVPVLPMGVAVNAVIGNVLLIPAYYLLVWGYSVGRALTGDRRALGYSIAWLVYFIPKLVSQVWSLVFPFEAAPAWALSRNGELFFAMTLCLILLLEFRQNFIKTQARQAASEARTRFLTGVSHELRTPLNGVLGSAELLSESSLTPAQRHYTDIISNSGNVLLNLINDTLDLAKYDEHEISLESVPFHLDRLLAECSANFLPEMARKKLPLFLDIGPEVPLRVVGDEFRLRQVLFNLLSNSIKFTRRGMVALRVSAEQASGRPALLTFSVKDTGVGIAPDLLEKIFEPFNQGAASTTREFGGSGLGLAISRAIVEHMGGTITVASRQGEGSEFVVRIPMKVNLGAEQERLARLHRLDGKRLLLLSDFEGVYDGLLPNLRHWGVEYDLVANTQAARDKLALNDYDGMSAYFMHAGADDLEDVRALGLNTVLMHHSSLPLDPEQWAQKVVDLPVPAGVQDIADTLIEILGRTGQQSADIQASTGRRVFSGDSAAVLVVEDNNINQMVTAGMLEYLGLQPELAENGQDACQKAQRKRYDLILMDCNMPVMDGYTAARRILALDHYPPPVIAALTADAQDETLERCREAGMARVLHKPLSIKELSDFLNELRAAAVSEPR
jgi:signal transduction histidine kinase